MACFLAFGDTPLQCLSKGYTLSDALVADDRKQLQRGRTTGFTSRPAAPEGLRWPTTVGLAATAVCVGRYCRWPAFGERRQIHRRRHPHGRLHASSDAAHKSSSFKLDWRHGARSACAVAVYVMVLMLYRKQPAAPGGAVVPATAIQTLVFGVAALLPGKRNVGASSAGGQGGRKNGFLLGAVLCAELVAITALGRWVGTEALPAGAVVALPAVGLVATMLLSIIFLGSHYNPLVWIAAAISVSGVAFSAPPLRTVPNLASLVWCAAAFCMPAISMVAKEALLKGNKKSGRPATSIFVIACVAAVAQMLLALALPGSPGVSLAEMQSVGYGRIALHAVLGGALRLSLAFALQEASGAAVQFVHVLTMPLSVVLTGVFLSPRALGGVAIALAAAFLAACAPSGKRDTVASSAKPATVVEVPVSEQHDEEHEAKRLAEKAKKEEAAKAAAKAKAEAQEAARIEKEKKAARAKAEAEAKAKAKQEAKAAKAAKDAAEKERKRKEKEAAERERQKLKAEAAEKERKRKEEEAAEKERKRLEQEAAEKERKRLEEEKERKRLEEEAAEKELKRFEEEAAEKERKRLEEEAAAEKERKRLEEEAAEKERKRLEEEAAAEKERKRLEEEAREKKRLEEEAAENERRGMEKAAAEQAAQMRSEMEQAMKAANTVETEKAVKKVEQAARAAEAEAAAAEKAQKEAEEAAEAARREEERRAAQIAEAEEAARQAKLAEEVAQREAEAAAKAAEEAKTRELARLEEVRKAEEAAKAAKLAEEQAAKADAEAAAFAKEVARAAEEARAKAERDAKEAADVSSAAQAADEAAQAARAQRQKDVARTVAALKRVAEAAAEAAIVVTKESAIAATRALEMVAKASSTAALAEKAAEDASQVLEQEFDVELLGLMWKPWMIKNQKSMQDAAEKARAARAKLQKQ